MQDLRDIIESTGKSVLAVNNLNYLDPPSQRVADYLVRPDLQVCAEAQPEALRYRGWCCLFAFPLIFRDCASIPFLGYVSVSLS